MFTICKSQCQKIVVLALVFMPVMAMAQSVEEPTQVSYFVSQRFWLASWDQRLRDVRLVSAPTATTPAVVSDGTVHTVSSKTIPITALGVKYGRTIGTISEFHDVGFDSNGNTSSGATHRHELDVSIGYQVVPGLTVSYIRKSGYTSANNNTATARLLGSDGSAKGTANLIGISANTSLSEKISMYGNIAAGPGRFKYQLGDGSAAGINSSYIITDFGLAYRAGVGLFDGHIDALTVQLGFRSQSINTPVTRFPTGTSGLTVIDDTNRGRATTEGLVLSIGAVF